MLILLRCAWVKKNKRAKCVIEQPSWRNIGCVSLCVGLLKLYLVVMLAHFSYFICVLDHNCLFVCCLLFKISHLF